MAQLAIRGHATRGREVIELLEMLGGKISHYFGEIQFGEIHNGSDTNCFYYIKDNSYIDICKSPSSPSLYVILSLEEFLEKFPYKIGDEVKIYDWIHRDFVNTEITCMRWFDNEVLYATIPYFNLRVKDIQPYKEETVEEQDTQSKKYDITLKTESLNDKNIINSYMDNLNQNDKGNISDGYHTFNELYEYRLLYNASMFNELAKQGLYDVHKSRHHSDGSVPFDDENWFIVQAELPTGQISNHYEMKDWDLFDIPIKDKANPYDGHSPQDVAKRLREFLTPKSKYPKTYEECCKVLSLSENGRLYTKGYKASLIQNFQKLYICRDAYWKIAGEQMGLGKPWEPLNDEVSHIKYVIQTIENEITCLDTWCETKNILEFPTAEMRDAFLENFKDLIEQCKELL